MHTRPSPARACRRDLAAVSGGRAGFLRPGNAPYAVGSTRMSGSAGGAALHTSVWSSSTCGRKRWRAGREGWATGSNERGSGRTSLRSDSLNAKTRTLVSTKGAVCVAKTSRWRSEEQGRMPPGPAKRGRTHWSEKMAWPLSVNPKASSPKMLTKGAPGSTTRKTPRCQAKAQPKPAFKTHLAR